MSSIPNISPTRGGPRPGAGRPKNTKSTRYVSINSMCAAIQNSLGITYQEALGDLVEELRNEFFALETGKRGRCKYPEFMLSLMNKLVEPARREAMDDAAEEDNIDKMSDEELHALATKKARELLEQAA